MENALDPGSSGRRPSGLAADVGVGSEGQGIKGASKGSGLSPRQHPLLSAAGRAGFHGADAHQPSKGELGDLGEG